LIDCAGAVRPAGTDPWALERESETLEKRASAVSSSRRFRIHKP
jgi:hypothetical protein